MGWVYLDDRFPEHPKVLAAGDQAAWLYVCGLAYTNRGSGNGTIPKAVIHRLTALRRPERLAAKLAEVGLWHDKGDHYLVNDYEEWNAKAIARRAQARKAAAARWSRDAHASPEHEPEHSSRNAGAMPSPKPHPQAPSPSPSDSRLSETHDWPDNPGESEMQTSNGSPPWKTDPLVSRWCDEVTHNQHPQHRMKVWRIIDHFRAHLDSGLIEEQIGRLATHKEPIGSPTFLLTTLERVAAEKDIEVPVLEGVRR